MKNDCPLEEWEQEQYFKWVYSNQIRYPQLQLITGSMNGIRLSPKLRAYAKRQGLRAGFPDIDIPIPTAGYHGAKIELKRLKGGVVSSDQKRVLKLLAEQGYYAVVCKGWRQAVSTTLWYLGIDV